jgi:hypothetical protein
MYHEKRLAKVVSLWFFIVALAWTSVPAMADVVLSFGFETLSSSYTRFTDTTGQLVATHTADLDGDHNLAEDDYTTGSVTRLVDPIGKAIFAWDPLGADFGSAAVQLTLNVTDINRQNGTAKSTGFLQLLDVDGDAIVGDVSGAWSLGTGSQAQFAGSVYNMSFVPSSHTFNGTSGRGFSMDFNQFNQLLGTFVDITDVQGGFFQNSFQNRASGMESHVIPVPGAAALGLFGWALLPWLKRRGWC